MKKYIQPNTKISGLNISAIICAGSETLNFDSSVQVDGAWGKERNIFGDETEEW